MRLRAVRCAALLLTLIGLTTSHSEERPSPNVKGPMVAPLQSYPTNAPVQFMEVTDGQGVKRSKFLCVSKGPAWTTLQTFLLGLKSWSGPESADLWPSTAMPPPRTRTVVADFNGDGRGGDVALLGYGIAPRPTNLDSRLRVFFSRQNGGWGNDRIPSHNPTEGHAVDQLLNSVGYSVQQTLIANMGERGGDAASSSSIIHLAQRPDGKPVIAITRFTDTGDVVPHHVAVLSLPAKILRYRPLVGKIGASKPFLGLIFPIREESGRLSIAAAHYLGDNSWQEEPPFQLQLSSQRGVLYFATGHQPRWINRSRRHNPSTGRIAATADPPHQRWSLEGTATSAVERSGSLSGGKACASRRYRWDRASSLCGTGSWR